MPCMSHFPWGVPSVEPQIHSLTEERPTLMLCRIKMQQNSCSKGCGGTKAGSNELGNEIPKSFVVVKWWQRMGIYLTTGSARFVGLPWWDDTIIWHISHLPLDSKAGSQSVLGRTVVRHLTFDCTTLWLKNLQYMISINHTFTTLRAGWQISTRNCQWWIIYKQECFKQGSLGSWHFAAFSWLGSRCKSWCCYSA